MLNIHHCLCAVPAQTKAELSAGLPFRVEYGELEAGLVSGGSSTDVRVDTLNQPININKPRTLNCRSRFAVLALATTLSRTFWLAVCSNGPTNLVDGSVSLSMGKLAYRAIEQHPHLSERRD